MQSLLYSIVFVIPHTANPFFELYMHSEKYNFYDCFKTDNADVFQGDKTLSFLFVCFLKGVLNLYKCS